MANWLDDEAATIMAVVNVNTDSFSDPRHDVDAAGRIAAAVAAHAAGARIIDLGAQSAALAAAVVAPEDQAAALVPMVAELVSHGIATSIDTYEAGVARATLDAGATLINDYGGAHDPALLEVVADSRAHYVLTHNPLGPRTRQVDPGYYGNVVDNVCSWFEQRLKELEAAGIPPELVVLDPGVDVAKTPAQTLELLRHHGRIRKAFANPQLWAVSRKDVLGAITSRAPAERDAATLALVALLADQPQTLLRVHDVAATADVIRVVTAIRGSRDLDPDALLDEALRRESLA